MLTSSMRSQSVASVGGTIGVQSSFFSASSSTVASTWAMNAALKQVPTCEYFPYEAVKVEFLLQAA